MRMTLVPFVKFQVHSSAEEIPTGYFFMRVSEMLCLFVSTGPTFTIGIKE